VQRYIHDKEEEEAFKKFKGTLFLEVFIQDQTCNRIKKSLKLSTTPRFEKEKLQKMVGSNVVGRWNK